jgi:hypothetical protein
MNKAVKPIVAIVILGAIGYGVGSYYATKIAKEHVAMTATKIQAQSSHIEKITYGDISANVFSLFTHDVAIENVKVYLKSLPKNPIVINNLDVDNYEVDASDVTKKFNISFKGLHLDNANQLLQQSLDVYSTDKSQMPVDKHDTEFAQKMLDKYLKSEASGSFDYSAKDSVLKTNLQIISGNGPLMHFSSEFDHYKIAKPVNYTTDGFWSAFANAKINKFAWNLDIQNMIDPKLITAQYPKLSYFMKDLALSMRSNIVYSANDNKLGFDFMVTNNKKKNIEMSTSIDDLKLGDYTMTVLANGKLHDAVSDAYIGFSKALANVSLTVPADLISATSPYSAKIVQDLGYKDYTISYNHNEVYDPKTKLENGDLVIGLQTNVPDTGASLSSAYQITINNKIMVKDIVEQLSKSLANAEQDGAEQGTNQLTQLVQTLKSESAFDGMYNVDSFSFTFKNQSLYQDGIKVFATMSNQKPVDIQKMIEGVVGKSAAEAKGVIKKPALMAANNFVQSPNEIKLVITPKGKLTGTDISNFLIAPIEGYQNMSQEGDKIDQQFETSMRDLQLRQHQAEADKAEARLETSQADGVKNASDSNPVKQDAVAVKVDYAAEEKALLDAYSKQSNQLTVKYTEQQKAPVATFTNKLNFVFSSGSTKAK